MDMTHIIGISGSVRADSLSRRLLEAILNPLAAHPATVVSGIDLAESGARLGQALSRDALDGAGEQLVRRIENADALVVCSPVYQGSYPGLLKHLFDLVDPDAIKGKPVALAAVGGSPRYSMMIEQHLRPLFAFFQAYTVPQAVFATASDFVGGTVVTPPLLGRIAAGNRQLLDLLSVSRRTPVAEPPAMLS